jgi:hypothetical protein
MDSYFLLFNKTTATEFSPAAQEIPFTNFTKGERGGFGVRESFFADSVTHKFYVSTLTKQSHDCKK